MKVVITVVGRDKVGIIAKVSAVLADKGVNILNINQNILDGYFNMVMIAELDGSKVPLREIQKALAEKGGEMGLEIKAQHEDIFMLMHKV
ncbi:MAG: ACT domain-containing protein [Bacillota bacterium]|nr:ACT domain-containing protein [Bacillota bacterium]